MTLLRDMKVWRSRAKTNLNRGARQPTLLHETEASCLHGLSGAHLSTRSNGQASFL